MGWGCCTYRMEVLINDEKTSLQSEEEMEENTTEEAKNDNHFGFASYKDKRTMFSTTTTCILEADGTPQHDFREDVELGSDHEGEEERSLRLLYRDMVEHKHVTCWRMH
ncbi:hypothetical protein RJT34_15151 [Clitoria ternatea]|uniref:Uncharacterized protein n=1 Tax=Clitoria ternatea TaxID=43366 RepID=A0AAN9PMZ5_CLITE